MAKATVTPIVAISPIEVFAPIPGTNEVWDLTAEAPKGALILNGTRFGVALGASGGSTFSKTVGPITISGPAAAAGYDALQAGVHTNGTFLFDTITGVTTTTDPGTPVYYDATSGSEKLTTTSTSNTLVGYVNYPKGFTKATGVAPIRIGE